jgi:hypothetical protein
LIIILFIFDIIYEKKELSKLLNLNNFFLRIGKLITF